MTGWYHHQLKEHEFEQTLGDGEGQGILVCCSPWGHITSVYVCVLSLQSCPALQAPPSLGFSRQEYWSGVTLPSPFHQ